MTADWIDISVPIYSGMVHWPDNPPVRVERIQDLSRGDAANAAWVISIGETISGPRRGYQK